MAVLEGCPGLKVEVRVNRRPLREYDDDEGASPNAATKYIEARSDAEFALRSTFSAPFPLQYGVQIRVSVDGSSWHKYNLAPTELYDRHGHSQRGFSFQENRKFFRRHFRFTALSIVEEAGAVASINDLQKDIQMKGCIKLEYRYITNVRPLGRIYARTQKENESLPALGLIPEKALKGDARSHQATLGAPRAWVPKQPAKEGDVVDEEPFATFRFKYRSLAALRALRIVPNEADDIPLEQRPDDQLTPEELREALRRMRRREAATVTVKQESEANGRVKREHNTEAHNDEDDDEVTIIESRRKRPRVDPDVIVLD